MRSYSAAQAGQSSVGGANAARYQLLEPRAGYSAEASESIGEGAYGIVFKALDTWTNTFVALKKIKLETEADGISSSTLREITLLMQLNHPNVVKLENVSMDRERMSLVFELLETDLRKYLDRSREPVPLETVKSISAQLLSGLAYCHSMGVMHRDLKPHNILVSNNGTVKIADFGLARTFTPFARPLTMEVITRWYRAPEIILGQSRYNCSVDLWSVGCIIAEISNRRPLFMGECDIDQLYKIFRLFGTPNNSSWSDVEDMPNFLPTFPQWSSRRLELFVPFLPPEGVDLLERLFVYDPRMRISAKNALRHVFVRDHVASADLIDPFQGTILQTPVSQTRSGSSIVSAPQSTVPLHHSSMRGGSAGSDSSRFVTATSSSIHASTSSSSSHAVVPRVNTMNMPHKVTPDGLLTQAARPNSSSVTSSSAATAAVQAPSASHSSSTGISVTNASRYKIHAQLEEEYEVQQTTANWGPSAADEISTTHDLENSKGTEVCSLEDMAEPTAVTKGGRKRKPQQEPPQSTTTEDSELAGYDPAGRHSNRRDNRCFLPIGEQPAPANLVAAAETAKVSNSAEGRGKRSTVGALPAPSLSAHAIVPAATRGNSSSAEKVTTVADPVASTEISEVNIPDAASTGAIVAPALPATRATRKRKATVDVNSGDVENEQLVGVEGPVEEAVVVPATTANRRGTRAAVKITPDQIATVPSTDDAQPATKKRGTRYSAVNADVKLHMAQELLEDSAAQNRDSREVDALTISASVEPKQPIVEEAGVNGSGRIRRRAAVSATAANSALAMNMRRR